MAKNKVETDYSFNGESYKLISWINREWCKITKKYNPDDVTFHYEGKNKCHLDKGEKFNTDAIQDVRIEEIDEASCTIFPEHYFSDENTKLVGIFLKWGDNDINISFEDGKVIRASGHCELFIVKLNMFLSEIVWDTKENKKK